MSTLLDLLRPEFDAHTAIIVPEDNLKITYAELRRQVTDVAESLAAIGIARGDRIGLAASAVTSRRLTNLKPLCR